MRLYPGLQGDETRQTFVLLLNKLLPDGVRGLVLASLLAALISSLDGVMNSVSTLVVRDFVLRFRPRTGEKTQVWIGRISIVAATALGVGAAILVWKTPGGLYRYLQAISIYLVMPITPAIVFGILSKRVTLKGAIASVICGIGIASVYVADQLVGIAAAQNLFPFLHHKLTFNYTYRGLWGTLIITAVLFIVSEFTQKTSPEKLVKTTFNWKEKPKRFAGITDWRLHLAVLSLITIALYAWLM